MAAVARSAARVTRSSGRVAAASAPRGQKAATAARTSSRAAKIDAAASVAAVRRPKLKVRTQSGVQRPVVTAMIVIVSAGFLHAWVVEKKAGPGRAFLVRMSIMGFVLALMSEITPKVGKGMAYLIMTAVIFDRSRGILTGLQTSERGMEREHGSAPPAAPGFSQDTTPVVLYSRVGPMPSEPITPIRQTVPRPTRGALYLS